jgi:hypothetical protein
MDNDITRKIIRYVFMVALIWLGVAYISAGKLDTYDVITLVLFVTACFIFIDMYYPVVVY